MPNVVIQQSLNEDPDFVQYLTELGFVRVVLGPSSARFMSKSSLAWQAIRASIRLFSHWRTVRKMGMVVVIGHFAYVIKCFARLHIIRYETLLCSNFFVRSPSWFPLFRFLSRMDTARDHYLVFSPSEIDLYADRFGIDRDRMHYVPCGDWCSPRQADLIAEDREDSLPGSYYFSGGYSNRDYIPLINAFRNIRAPLIIVCSSLNKELGGISLPRNVTVFRDLPSHVFDAYARHARAGIVPLRHDAGASGQTVTLRLMRNARVVIASDIGPIREFIEPGVSGYLVRDLQLELPAVIARIENDPVAAAAVGQAAYHKYLACFSRASVSKAFKSIIEHPDVLSR